MSALDTLLQVGAAAAPIAGGVVGSFFPGGTMPGIMAGSALGQVLGGIAANDMSQQSVAQQEQFQMDMSNTAWQRGMSSMSAAGLNPLYAAQVGPASTPMGASYTAVNPFQGLAASAAGAYSAMSQQSQAETAGGRLSMDEWNSETQRKVWRAQAGAYDATARLDNVNSTLQGYQLNAGKAWSQFSKDNPTSSVMMGHGGSVITSAAGLMGGML